MARNNNRVVWTYPDSGDEELVYTNPEHAWTIAEASAENHVAGWIFYLANRPVPGFRLATAITVAGLPRRKPHPQGTFTWQVEGAALLIAAGFKDPTGWEVYLSDYRTAEGRIDRKRNASTVRAHLICVEMEAGAHPRVAFDRHRLPPVPRVTAPAMTSEDHAALEFYRSMVARGELAQ